MIVRLPVPFARATPLCALIPLVAACSHMSGLDGSAEYACKAPVGVHCQSVSGTYFNSVQNNLPAQRQRSRAVPPAQPTPAARAADVGGGGAPPYAGEFVATASVETPAPSGYRPGQLRTDPRVLRLWIKPWEDADHDLHDQQFLYVVAEPARWRVGDVQREIREQFAPVHAPRPPLDSPAALPGATMPPTAARASASAVDAAAAAASVLPDAKPMTVVPSADPR